MFTQQTITKVKEIPIKEIARVCNLEAKRNKVLSPATNEKTPSLHLYENSNTFKDFSGGSAGDTIAFYQLIKPCSFEEAVLWLCKEFKIEPEFEKNGSTAKTPDQVKEEEEILILNQHLQNFFADNIEQANLYLQKRQIDQEQTKKFGIGYAAAKLPDVIVKNYSKEFLQKTGAINNAGYCFFSNRLIFPIHDRIGRVVAFIGRVLNEEQPKYLNTPETYVFKKSNVWYGFFQAKEQIRKTKTAYVVEGVTDVIAMHQAGYSNTIAGLGTGHPNPNLLYLAGAEKVIICKDGDKAGQESAIRDIGLFLAAGFFAYVIELPEQADPDSFLKQNKELPPPQEAVFWLAEKLLNNVEDVSDKTKAIQKIKSVISLIKNDEYKTELINIIAKKYKINKNSLKAPAAPEPQPEPGKTNTVADSDMFVRVGTDYFKKIVTTNPETGSKEIRLKKWKYETIKTDFGQIDGFFKSIKKYDTFCMLPGFFDDYKPEVKDYDAITKTASVNYNLCSPLTYKPQAGSFDTIKNFLIHLFAKENSKFFTPQNGDPLTIILDCFRIKFTRPKEVLPVLCLVSEEQKTGKSTFLKLCNLLFCANAAIVQKEHLLSPFNTSYADKLFIGAEEIKIDIAGTDKDLKNKLKSLATEREIYLNIKGVTAEKIPFFGWLVMTTNHEDNFMRIEPDDTRFWVIKAKKVDKLDAELIQKMAVEVPAFVHFLLNTPIHHKNSGRGWFKNEYLQNEYWKKVVKTTLPYIDRTVTDFIKNTFLSFYFTPEKQEIAFKCDLTTLCELVNKQAKARIEPKDIEAFLNKKGLERSDVQKFEIAVGYEKDTYSEHASIDDLNFKIDFRKGKGRTFRFLYPDWIEEADHTTPEMKDKHKQLMKDVF